MLAQADQTQQAEPVAPNTVFVGNLANDFLEDKVQELFSPIAPVYMLHLSKGYCSIGPSFQTLKRIWICDFQHC